LPALISLLVLVVADSDTDRSIGAYKTGVIGHIRTLRTFFFILSILTVNILVVINGYAVDAGLCEHCRRSVNRGRDRVLTILRMRLHRYRPYSARAH